MRTFVKSNPKRGASRSLSGSGTVWPTALGGADFTCRLLRSCVCMTASIRLDRAEASEVVHARGPTERPQLGQRSGSIARCEPMTMVANQVRLLQIRTSYRSVNHALATDACR